MIRHNLAGLLSLDLIQHVPLGEIGYKTAVAQPLGFVENIVLRTGDVKPSSTRNLNPHKDRVGYVTDT